MNQTHRIRSTTDDAPTNESSPPLLTFVPDARAPHTLAVDLERLVVSRMLLQANSGGGKSWALRYLLEQTHGHIQQLIIDPEGEFATLRAHFPYVLVGRDGDIPADPATAGALCTRLMELHASAIFDLYDLRLPARRAFVQVFLDQLLALPRDQWHPVLVIVDEAQVFAPQRGVAESTDAVISLCTQGRKRGLRRCLPPNGLPSSTKTQRPTCSMS